MEKVVRGVFLSLLVLGMGAVANAGWTTVVYNEAVTSEVTLNATYAWGTTGWHELVQWDQEWIIPNPTSTPTVVVTGVDLTSAQLSIQSQYTSDKTENVYVASTSNPSLGNLQSGWTGPIDVLSYETDLDGDVTIYARLFDNPASDAYDVVVLNKSKLDLVYQITTEVWEDDPIPPAPIVPAPAALILSSLGAGLVGWLRRRGTV